MPNVLAILLGLIYAASCAGFIYFLVRSQIAAIQAAKRRRPGRSFWHSMGLMQVSMSRDGYLPEAEPFRRKSIVGCLGSLLCWLIAAIIGLLISHGK